MCSICDKKARSKLMKRKVVSWAQSKAEVKARRQRFEYFREHPEALYEVRWADGVPVMSRKLVVVVSRQSRLDEGVWS